MAPRRDSKEETNSHKRNDQGECDPEPEQQQPETDLPSGDAPTRRGIADHPNRRWIVIQPDSSYIPRPGPDRDHIIKPWQVNAVVGAPRDRVDEVMEQVRDLEEPPSEGDFQAHTRQPALGIGHHCETVSHTTVPPDTPAASDRSGSKGCHGKSAGARQGLIDRESGMSLDGFPSRSLEEGGVSGLCQCKSGSASNGSTSAAATCCSSSSRCASATESSIIAVDGATIHTARAVTIRPTRAERPRGEKAAVHRMPSPEALERMDEAIEDVERFLRDFDPGTAMTAPVQASNGDGDEMLTGNRDVIVTPPDQDRALRSEGKLRPPSSPGQRYTQGRPATRMDDADGHPTGVKHTQPSSPTPSESSIVETVFNVRQPTPPPRRPDVGPLPSSQRHEVTAVGPPGGLRRGGVHHDSDVERQLAVPAVLVPGGGRGRLGLGGSQPPRKVSRRQGQGDPAEEEKQERRRRKRREE